MFFWNCRFFRVNVILATHQSPFIYNGTLYCIIFKMQNLSWYKTGFVTCRTKTGFVPTLNQPLQNRLCVCSKTDFVPTLNQPLRNRLSVCSKTGFVPS